MAGQQNSVNVPREESAADISLKPIQIVRLIGFLAWI